MKQRVEGFDMEKHILGHYISTTHRQDLNECYLKNISKCEPKNFVGKDSDFLSNFNIDKSRFVYIRN